MGGNSANPELSWPDPPGTVFPIERRFCHLNALPGQVGWGDPCPARSLCLEPPKDSPAAWHRVKQAGALEPCRLSAETGYLSSYEGRVLSLKPKKRAAPQMPPRIM